MAEGTKSRKRYFILNGLGRDGKNHFSASTDPRVLELGYEEVNRTEYDEVYRELFRVPAAPPGVRG